MTPPDSPQNKNKTPSRRTLIIPHKRGLLPLKTGSVTTNVQKTINPSALPAEIQLRRPVFSSLETREKEDDTERESRYNNMFDLEDSAVAVCTVEFDSSQAPQPFLEPELAERRVARAIEKRQDAGSGSREEKQDDEEDEEQGGVSLAAQLSTEREVRRRAARAEYGGMAVRDRMTVSGRGRRRR